MRVNSISSESFNARKPAPVMSRFYNKKYQSMPKKIEYSLDMLNVKKTNLDVLTAVQHTALLIYNSTKALVYKGLSVYYLSKFVD